MKEYDRKICKNCNVSVYIENSKHFNCDNNLFNNINIDKSEYEIKKKIEKNERKINNLDEKKEKPKYNFYEGKVFIRKTNLLQLPTLENCTKIIPNIVDFIPYDLIDSYFEQFTEILNSIIYTKNLDLKEKHWKRLMIFNKVILLNNEEYFKAKNRKKKVIIQKRLSKWYEGYYINLWEKVVEHVNESSKKKFNTNNENKIEKNKNKNLTKYKKKVNNKLQEYAENKAFSRGLRYLESKGIANITKDNSEMVKKCLPSEKKNFKKKTY